MTGVRSLTARFSRRLVGFLGRISTKSPSYRYWESRARAFGVRSVLDLRHTDDELEAVTAMQEGILFPLLRARLRPDDRRLLDYGCGPGRFTPGLARVIDGSVVGVDPIQHYLDLAPKADRVEYRTLERGAIPAPDRSFDVVWICLVFGGIVGRRLVKRSVREIDRVLKPDGLLFLVENTSETRDSPYWKYRSVDAYRKLFPFAALRVVSEYSDLGERMSVLAGRKT